MIKKEIKPLILLSLGLLVSLLAIWSGDWWQNHDPAAVLRLKALGECFADGQLPCRWTSRFGGGFGLPLFQFYPPMFYLVGYFFNVFGASLTLSLKLALVVFGLGGVWGLYLLLRQWFSRLASFGASWFFTFAPFVALEVFVRGDLAEMAAVWFFPLSLLFLLRFARKKSSTRFGLAVLGVTVLCLTHNIQLVILSPLVFLWALIWSLYYKNGRAMVAIGVGVGLAAFFILPAWFGKNQVQIGSLTEGYFDFHHHFVGGRRLFLGRSWLEGVTGGSRAEELILQLGWPHWWPLLLLPFVFGALPVRFRRPLLAVLALWILSVGMMTRFSLPAWETLPLLSFLQFPWRFLGLASLLTCGLTAFLFEALGERSKNGREPLVFGLLVLAAVLNFGYFQSQGRVVVDDGFYATQSWASVHDYLPLTVESLPSFASGWPRFEPDQSEGQVVEFSYSTNYFKTKINLFDEGTVRLVIPVFDYPNWQVFIDELETISGYLYPAEKLSNPEGLIVVEVQGEGDHLIEGWLRPNQLERVANGISLVNLACFYLIYLLYAQPTKKEK